MGFNSGFKGLKWKLVKQSYICRSTMTITFTTQLSYLLANDGTQANNYMFRPLYQPLSSCTS